jgi:hypothetical protein
MKEIISRHGTVFGDMITLFGGRSCSRVLPSGPQHTRQRGRQVHSSLPSSDASAVVHIGASAVQEGWAVEGVSKSNGCGNSNGPAIQDP